MNLLETATHVTDLQGSYVEYASHPSDPGDGDMYYNTTGDIIYRYNGDSGYWEGVKLT